MEKNNDPFMKELIEKIDRWVEDDRRYPIPHMSAEYAPYERLFSSIRVNGVLLKNRIVMGPMGNINMAEETGRPNQKMIDYFSERARGGVGLITSGLVPVSQGIDPAVTEPGDRSIMPRLDHRSRTVFSGWRTLAQNVHAYGGHFFIQLTPGLGRVGSPEVLLTKHRLPVSASWNPNFYMPAVPCRPLTDGECRRIVKNMGQAAADAKALLIDGVYLHGHEGYLLEQMTNPAYNRRKFGRYRDAPTFGIECVAEIRKRVGPAYPIMYRIDLSLALKAVYSQRMESSRILRNFRNERTSSMTLDYIINLIKAGVDLIDVDLGSYDNWWLPHPPNSMPPGCYLEVAKLVKDHLASVKILSNAGLPVPVVAVGKLGYPDLAERALREGYCDMIMLARPLLADPDWPRKAAGGWVNRIRPCIGDQEACLNEFLEGGHLQCAVNPRTGFEDVIPPDLTPAPKALRIAVVGAGPAGITAAAAAARRGHHVTLYEKQNRLGGMLVPGSTPRIKYEVANYLAYLEGSVDEIRATGHLDLHLGQNAHTALLIDAGFDAIILCSGGLPLVPQVPGIDLPHVIQAVDLLRDPRRADSAERIVIVGGGAVGCETAYYLAVERGKQVTLIEMLPQFMKGVCTANRTHLIYALTKCGVPLLNCTRLTEIRADGITVLRNRSKTVPDASVTWTPLLPENVVNPLARPIGVAEVEEFYPADLVILAAGLRPDTSQYEALRRAGVGTALYHIGDAFQIGRVFEAVKAGFAVGRTI